MISIKESMIMRIEANGIQINFELSGKEDASVVVLSHSLGSGMAMWKPQLEALEPYYRVLNYDMPVSPTPSWKYYRLPHIYPISNRLRCLIPACCVF